MKPLIDGDIIAYSVASVADGKRYVAPDGHEERYKKDMAKYCERKGIDLLDVETNFKPEKIEYALHSVKQMVKSVLDHFDEVENYSIFISPEEGNFRESIGTILKYKGNRVDMRRPYHLPNCREYLVEQWTAEVVEGQEADDAMGIAQFEQFSQVAEGNFDNSNYTTCICTRDKDLDMVPGWHYNWETDKRYFVTEVQAWRNFYCQLLTGDSTDNILGLFGVGKNSQLVKQVKQMDDSDEMFSHVAQQYFKRFGNYWATFLLENARLLWIRREADEMWEPSASQQQRLEADTEGKVQYNPEETS